MISISENAVFFSKQMLVSIVSSYSTVSMSIVQEYAKCKHNPPPTRVILTGLTINFYMQGRYQYKYPNRKTNTYVYIV